jgi:hypothetical protein
VIRESEPDLRRHPRASITWPVTVEVGDQRLRLTAVNLSPFGAKVQLERTMLRPGMTAQLRFDPPNGRPLDVRAIVWRVDPDGAAFFFIGVDGANFTFPTGAP